MEMKNVKKQQITKIISWYTHQEMKMVNVKKQQKSMLFVNF